MLLAAGAVTVGFSFLFGVRSARAQAVMTAALAGAIGLQLLLIVALDDPFAGDARLRPDALAAPGRASSGTPPGWPPDGPLTARAGPPSLPDATARADLLRTPSRELQRAAQRLGLIRSAAASGAVAPEAGASARPARRTPSTEPPGAGWRPLRSAGRRRPSAGGPASGRVTPVSVGLLEAALARSPGGSAGRRRGCCSAW